MNYFKLKENNTTVSTEIFAGVTTFMTMAYILAVNPSILGAAGMDTGAVFTATALASFVGTLMMALLANYPFAVAPGMGLNAFFAFTVASVYGWQIALLAVFVEGVLFLIFSLFSIRELLVDSIPKNLKLAIGVGIGLFITFVGLQGAGIVVQNPATAVALGNVKTVQAGLALIGTVVTAALVTRRVKGGLLFGILFTYLLGILCQLGGLYVPNPDAGVYSLIPASIISLPPSVKDTNLWTAVHQIDFSVIKLSDFCVVVFAFLFSDMFDTIGTLVGVSEKTNFLDKNGKLPRLKQALLADAVATTFGAVLGTSAITAYIESASGVAEGGRTGLTSLVTSLLFLVALLFSPIFVAIPAFATAPALIVVGLFMMEVVLKIDFSDYTESFPAFVTIFMIPFCYSISDGLIFGIISYVFIKLCVGKWKDVSVVMYVLSLLFLLKLIFL